MTSHYLNVLGLGPKASRMEVNVRFQEVQEAYRHLMDEYDRADQEGLPPSSSGEKRKREGEPGQGRHKAGDDRGPRAKETGEKRMRGAGEGEQGRSQRRGGACGSGTGDGDNKVNPDINDSLNRLGIYLGGHEWTQNSWNLSIGNNDILFN